MENPLKSFFAIWKLVCLLGMLAGGWCAARAQQPPLLTLAEAISTAERMNVAVQSARENVDKAAAGVKQARSRYYPQLKINGLASFPFQAISFTIPRGTLGVYPGLGPLPAQNAVIAGSQDLTGCLWSSAAQPLTQLYRVHLAVKQAGVAVQFASEQRRYTQQQLAQQVRQTYYGIPALEAQVHALEGSVAWLQRQELESKERLQQRTILKSDLLSVQAKLAQQLYEQRVAGDALALQKESLNKLLGRPLDQDFRVEDEPPLPDVEADAAQARRLALALRPEVRQAALQAASAEYDVRKERAEYIPQVSLTVNELALSGNKFLPTAFGGAGLQFSWQPFDWGEKKQQLRALKIMQHEAVLTEQDTRQAVQLDVDRNLNALQEAMLAVKVSRMARDAEAEKLREMQAQFEQKAILLSSLLQERSSVDQEESQYVQAVSQLWTAQANLRRALGKDE